MKRLFLMICALIGVFLFVSCGEKENNQNPLKGTLWAYSYENYISHETIFEYLEFTDDTHVVHWNTNDAIRGNGTYTYSGNSITFSNLKFKIGPFSSEENLYKSATFTAKSMVVSYEIPGYSLGHDMTKNYIKQ